MIKKRDGWIIDYETLLNCTVLVAVHYQTDETRVFVIHRYRNDILEMIAFLEECEANHSYHITFNGLEFDGQLSEYIIELKDVFMNDDSDGQYIANQIYEYAQKVINKRVDGEFLDVYEKDLRIPQIDVYKLNHWDNPAKMSSLKWIQFTMDWKNMQEMPIFHGQYIDTQEQIDTIISYCINDCLSTKNIFILCKDQILLRKDLSKEFGLLLMSASEPRLSRELFLLFLSEKMGINKYDLRNLRTFRNEIRLNRIILPYIKFNSKEFQDLHQYFMSRVVNKHDPKTNRLVLKGALGYEVKYKGVSTFFGSGGVHGAAPSGIYESTEDEIIMTSDVTSFYPMLAIQNKWSPAHLNPQEFCEQYSWFFTERMKIPKTNIKNYVYKIILNSTYGLSNEVNSFLYDPELTLRITVNGQLSLMMLYEMLCEGIPEAKPLMQNTDGLEMIIPKGKKETYLAICKQWEEITKLSLEHDQYKKIFLGDVNNYIGIFENGKTKCKGRFEFENLALHKNKSMLIIPKAIYNYFVKGIAPEETIMDNNNIFDYCAGVKAKSGWIFEETINTKGTITRNKLSKVVRYYVSNEGNRIIKRNVLDGREINIEAETSRKLTTFNQYVKKPWSQYDIDTGYYLKKIYEEIYALEGTKQLQLF